MEKKKKPNLTLITLLAYQRTPQLRALLKKYGIEDAKNYSDLEVKIAQLYTNSDKKVELEKEFAEIHPHKSFILKHLAPKEKSVEEIKEEMLKFAKEENSNCEGNPDCKCNENKSNACGCGSGFDGDQTKDKTGFDFKNPTHWIGPGLFLLSASIIIYGLISSKRK
jgi:hypothetical protein